MKKVVSFIAVVFMFCMMSVSVLAGDIPEALNCEDHAQVFIGTLKDFQADMTSSSPRFQDVAVIPSFKIKGDVALNELQTYDSCYFGKVTPEKEQEYLFGWLADNSVWVYAIESYDETEINLKITDAFSERIQRYLNEGLYQKREQERLSKIQQSMQTNILNTSVIGGANEPTNLVIQSNHLNYRVLVIAGLGAFVLVFTGFLVMKKRKNT